MKYFEIILIIISTAIVFVNIAFSIRKSVYYLQLKNRLVRISYDHEIKCEYLMSTTNNGLVIDSCRHPKVKQESNYHFCNNKCKYKIPYVPGIDKNNMYEISTSNIIGEISRIIVINFSALYILFNIFKEVTR